MIGRKEELKQLKVAYDSPGVTFTHKPFPTP